MAKIHIDGQDYEVEAGKNLLHTCLSLGFDLPYFCWHPAMGSVGACRQCAVKQFKDEADTKGKIVMSCMTAVTDGMRISVDDPEAREFRKGVIEWLMTNHPHDCPVCDEGGECHLQDMTVMTGHASREFRFDKRTHRNQDLGPLVNHEMNRCIACYRCVRFYRDIAGGRDLDVLGAHHHVYFGRHTDGTLESEFSGNLVEVCPTGVFTDKTLKEHYTRKWDLQVAPSVCVHCAVGCNTIPGERYGTLRRIRNRYNRHVNGYFLCDRGRYGYEFVDSERRVRRAVVRGPNGSGQCPIVAEPAQPHPSPPLPASGEGAREPSPRLRGERRGFGDDYRTRTDNADALEHTAAILRNNTKVIGIGSPRASLEANFALRTLVGPDRFFLGMSEADARLTALALSVLREGPARSPSLRDVEQCDAVLVLGEDVTNTAPMLALALRQALRNQPGLAAEKLRISAWNDAAVRELVQDEHGPLFIASPHATRLDDVATRTHRAAPDRVARLGFAVAHILDATAPALPTLPDATRSLAREIAHALRTAKRPLVVAGMGCASEAVIQAAANVAWALSRPGRPADLCFALPECNSLGLATMGGGTLAEAFDMVRSGEAETVIVLENDLYRRAEASAVDALFAKARHVIVLDHLSNATTEKAEVLLPAATFAESDGTLMNSEGRAQRFYGVMPAEGEVRESWRWLRDLARRAQDGLQGEADGTTPPRPSPQAGRESFDAMVQATADGVPALRAIAEIAPPAGFRIHGQKIPRQPHRYSGRTAMRANVAVSEPQSPGDPDSALAFSMEGADGPVPAALAANYWAPGWNSVQSLHKFQQAGGPHHKFQEEVDGEWRGGDAGKRLIEPAPDGSEKPPYFADIPEQFAPRPGEWLLVPIHHIFGSEELSILSRGIAQLAPQPYLALNAEDAERAGLKEGQEVEVRLGILDIHVAQPPSAVKTSEPGEAARKGFTAEGGCATCSARGLVVRIFESLPRGVAGWPAGLPRLPWLPLPAWVQIGGAR